MSAARLTAMVVSGAIVASACIVSEAVPESASVANAAWDFQASLDGKPIGGHRFTIATQGDERRVTSEATFAVKFLGITAYRYRHVASERWRNGCLESLDSSTNDDGRKSSVSTTADGGALKVVTPSGAQALSGCVMSFAYWNPAIQEQSHLLNAQTGKYESVEVARIGSGTVDVRGRAVAAVQYRITGAEQPIDVWYSTTGDWVGLDSIVAGGRKLSYRLQ